MDASPATLTNTMVAIWRRAGRYFGLVAAPLLLLCAGPCLALDKVSLQLKWKHQFQFAGYYAALAHGFYRDAGLDVEIREGGPQIDASEEVALCRADFGVCASSILIRRPDQPRLSCSA